MLKLPFINNSNSLDKRFYSELLHIIGLSETKEGSKKLDPEIIHRPKQPKILPNVLSLEEVKKILLAPTNLKHRTMLMVLYSCGLRRGELLNLKFSDIHRERGIILVRQGKGNKDRIVGLPGGVLKSLGDYYHSYRPKEYVFEGQKGGSTAKKVRRRY